MTDQHVCPDCDEYERVAHSLQSALVDALEAWIKTQPAEGVSAEASVAGAARLVADIAAQVSPLDQRNDVVAVALLTMLESSGCDIRWVLEFVREQMEHHMVEAGRA